MGEQAFIDATVAAIAATEDHMRHEYSGDWDATLETVQQEARYALATPDGAKSISGHAGIDAHYHSFEGIVVPHASRLVAQIATDWYMFFENFPTRIEVASGKWDVVHTATLAPVAPPRIVGEMLWQRQTEADDHADDPRASIESLHIHERYLDAMLSGDRSALGDLIDDAAMWGERDYLSPAAHQPVTELAGKDAAVTYCADWHAAYAPQRVSILNRLATAWYVFAEELWIVAPKAGHGERRQYRKATIYPITPAGRIGGALGWGTDPVTASGAAADASFGAAFWEGSVVAHDPDPKLQGRRLA